MDAAEIAAWSAGAAGCITAVVSALVVWSKQKSTEAHDSHAEACKVLKERLQITESRLDVTQSMVMDCEQKHATTKADLAGLKVMAEDCFKDRNELRDRVKKIEDTVRIDN
jgi:hypothetical protein